MFSPSLLNRFLRAAVVVWTGLSSAAWGAHLTDADYQRNFRALRYPAAGTGDFLPYRLLRPYKFKAAKKYPLVLTLHGAGERGTDNWAQVDANYLAKIWADSTSQARFPCFVVAPQCPYNARDSQWVNTAWTQTTYVRATVPISRPLAMAIAIVDSLVKACPQIDTNRIYIAGLSMGGWGVWDAVTRFPEKFAAAVPMCGGGDTSEAGAIGALAVWAAVGTLDSIIPPQATRNMVAALERRSGAAVRTIGTVTWTNTTILTRQQFVRKVSAVPTPDIVFNEYSNAQHEVWEPLLDDTLLIPWVFSKIKILETKGGRAIRTR
jgi:predicted peptidase